MPERELQQLVSDFCGWLGLLHVHVYYAKHMTPGWPDSTIVGERIIYRELKTQTGRLSAEQRDVRDRLKAAGGDWAIWRPRDWLDGTIERELRLLKGQPMLPLTG